MHMSINPEHLTHATLLTLLPFTTGYLCDEDGSPSYAAVMSAILLQAVSQYADPRTIRLKQLLN
jgi:hypothetical protein